MLFQYRTFWLPKDVQDPNGYEDAFHVDAERGVAAVCDGVSSSLYSGRWAGILAHGVVADAPNVNDPQAVELWLKRHRETWAASIDESSLAWHQKPKLLDGAATTLLWVEVTTTGADDGVARPYQVRAYSIGDCCLFHVRGGQVLQTFPIQDSGRFEDNPQAIRSVYKRSDVVAFEAMETQCNPGDLLLLCTDAVATWTMRQLEAGVQLDWGSYWRMSHEDWQAWLTTLRQDNQIRYDDSTAVLLCIGSEQSEPPVKPPTQDDKFLDVAETKIRGAFKSLKGTIRKGLRDLSDSKWLSERDKK